MGCTGCMPGFFDTEASVVVELEVPNDIRLCHVAWMLPHQKKVSAQRLLAQALAVDGRVDFPIVTEICERVSEDALQLAAVVRLLSSALQVGHTSDDLSRQVKALTIAHELLYDALARRAMFETPGLIAALRSLGMSTTADVEGPAAECVRLLTYEISERLISEFDHGHTP